MIRVAAWPGALYASPMSHHGIGGQPAGDDSSRSGFERLLVEFGNAWENGRPALMAAIFAEDATFIPGPFEEAVKGRTAIAEYWRDVPVEQSAISFRAGEIFLAGPWFATEFSCTYRRIRTGEWIRVSGALFCETAAGKIQEMRMYWDRAPVSAP